MKLRSVMREYPIKPVDKAVWWTEHVIKYGADHLRTPAANMSWTDYYEVKLIIIVLSILTIILAILGFIVKKIINLAFKLCRPVTKLKSN